MLNPFKTKEQTFAPLVSEVMSQVQKAPLMGDSESAARMEARQVAMKRPGDQPLRGYLDKQRGALESTHAGYAHELDLLNADIAKLQEDRRQLIIAMSGVTAALKDMEHADKDETVRRPRTTPVAPSQNTPGEPVLDEAALNADIDAALAADDGGTK